jgi:hypothetical protein
VLLYLLGKSSKWFSTIICNIAGRTKIAYIFGQLWMRWLCIAVAIFLIIFLILEIFPSLEAKDLLFANPDQKEAQAEVELRITEESLGKLASDYERAVLFVVLSGFILWGVGKILQDREEKPTSMILYVSGRLRSGPTNRQEGMKKAKVLLVFGKSFLYLLFTTELILLPIKYGQSVYSNEFHQLKNLVIDRSLKGEMESGRTTKDESSDETQWLLRETPDSYVLYYGKSKQLVIIQKSHVLRISLDRRRNIFESFAKDQE